MFFGSASVCFNLVSVCFNYICVTTNAGVLVRQLVQITSALVFLMVEGAIVDAMQRMATAAIMTWIIQLIQVQMTMKNLQYLQRRESRRESRRGKKTTTKPPKGNKM